MNESANTTTSQGENENVLCFEKDFHENNPKDSKRVREEKIVWKGSRSVSNETTTDSKTVYVQREFHLRKVLERDSYRMQCYKLCSSIKLCFIEVVACISLRFHMFFKFSSWNFV